MKFIIIGLCFFIVFGVGDSAIAGGPLIDPDIPDGEEIIYVSTVENKSETIVEETKVRTEEGRQVYEITSRSDATLKKIKLAKDTMAILSSYTLRRLPDAEIETKNTITEKKQNPRKDELKVGDFSALMYLLRGFPFGELKVLNLSGYEKQEKKNYSIYVKFSKKEKIKIRGKIIECYRLEFGATGFWAAFFPKAYLWYRAERPHYLVRFEGPSSVPGSPKHVLELASYSVK